MTPFSFDVKALRAILSFGKGLVLSHALTLGLLIAACGSPRETAAGPSKVEPVLAKPRPGPIAPIEPATVNEARLALGRSLFSDVRLSGNGKVACSSCHDLALAGVDRRPLSTGASGELAAVNTPTVFNAALNFRQFWDGRATTLEEQIDGPLLNPKEMGSSWAKALTAIKSDTAYSAQFAKSYPGGVTEDNVKDAIASFERSLATPGAPFDRYLAGELDAIDEQTRRGYELFTGYGCASCHQGRGVGGNMFQKLGVMADYFADRGHQTRADLGRYNVTHDEQDRHVFKVPSLRNVAKTAPYLHDGSVATLDEVVRIMARYQLGRDLDAADVQALVAFLQSLTGTYEGRSL